MFSPINALSKMFSGLFYSLNTSQPPYYATCHSDCTFQIEPAIGDPKSWVEHSCGFIPIILYKHQAFRLLIPHPKHPQSSLTHFMDNWHGNPHGTYTNGQIPPLSDDWGGTGGVAFTFPNCKYSTESIRKQLTTVS